MHLLSTMENAAVTQEGHRGRYSSLFEKGCLATHKLDRKVWLESALTREVSLSKCHDTS